MLDAAEAAYVFMISSGLRCMQRQALFTPPQCHQLRMRRMGSALQSKLLDLDQFEAVLNLGARTDERRKLCALAHVRVAITAPKSAHLLKRTGAGSAAKL